MDPLFWHERWRLNEIGFHQPQEHAWLVEFWPQVCHQRGQVFVPLCGKSLDMVWLLSQGFEVLGVELSPVAVTQFFQEQHLQAETGVCGVFQSYRAQGLELLCGDFFALGPQQQAVAVYDRGALVAMPCELQERYARHLLEVLPHQPPMLLVTFEYDQTQMQGPPFSTPEERIRDWFGHTYSLENLAVRDCLEQQPVLKSRGLSRLEEKAWLLTPLG